MTESTNSEMRLAEETLREEVSGRSGTATYGVSYLVEAGAGAGKTHILVNRIINQLLTGQARPEQLAAITFTEKAAQEMVERIDQELNARLNTAKAEHGAESEEALRLRGVIESVDQMPISTIHSFCKSLLTTMPFASELGPDFEVEEDYTLLADAFFDAQVQERPERFRKCRELTGIPYDYLKESFRKICESRAEIVCERMSDAELARRFADMRAMAGSLYELLHEYGSEANIKNKTSDTVAKLMPKINAILRLKDGTKEAFVKELLSVCDPCTENRRIEIDAAARVLPGKITDNKRQVEALWKPIAESWQAIHHALSLETLCGLLPDYRSSKRQKKIATQQELLYCARDMLRNDAEARSFFHKKYSCIYVDEMQDTDPVQAQILFYLTTNEVDFDPEDWRNCKPTPGSLFLVGDPKQAIYRFRGADITVYKTLKRLFQDGIGRVEHLHFNYRSASEITAFCERVFRPLMNGGDYQADFSAMSAVSGSSPNACIHAYYADRKSDPAQVAAFIAEMIHNRTTVGTGQKLHEARYADFMILTNTKARTADYVKALAEYAIPCSMAGARQFGEFPQLRRGNAVLQHLSDPDDETKLAAVLVNCYGIPFETLRRYKEAAGWLSSNPEDLPLEEEGAYERLRLALEELSMLRRQAKTLSPLALAETLWLKSRAVWQGTEDNKGAEAYSLVLQFLHILGKETLSLSALAARSAEYLNGSADRELLLTEETNCVRVMNMHKAKGLEAEIVILAYDSVFRADAEQHVQDAGNKEQMALCLSHTGPYTRVVFAKPKGWDDGPGREEKTLLEEQIVRLHYVAATRAKSALLVCAANRTAWKDIADACEQLDTSDENWERAITALESGETSFSRKTEQTADALLLCPEKLEEALRERAERLSGKKLVNISPSMLENRDALPAPTDARQEQSAAALPHGAIWGTLVHRLFELCVSQQAFSAVQREGFARQAVYETLAGETLPAADRKALDAAGRYETEDALSAYLAESALHQTAFLEEPDHALRKLLTSGKCYTELPFELRLVPGDPLRTLCGAMLTGHDDLSAEMRGVMDLSIHTEEGWILLDYKTDILLEGETTESFAERMKRQYTPQLRVYREILNRLQRGPVKAVYLCAISLGGRLIELPV